VKRGHGVLVVAAAVVAALAATLLAPRVARAEPERVTVGSKAFPESWILGEAATLLARGAGADARHAQNLGATEIAYGALTSGEIDAYPEYTGTIAEVLVHGDAASLGAALAARGLAASAPLGFDDGYALAMARTEAERLGVATLSDLAPRAELRFGLTHEFLGRADGFPGLSARYGLAPHDVRAVEHELALEAASRGDLDVVDAYTTDAQLDRLGLVVLRDDRAFFPRYDAVLLYRADLPARAPRAFAAMMRLAGHVDARAMRAANAGVVLEHRAVGDAARQLLRDGLGDGAGAALSAAPADSAALEVGRAMLRHIELVVVALLASILAGVPLGVLASRSRAVAAVVVAAAGVLQTVPSLALLALLVPLLGIGVAPALVALFLYGLLPIVRNTHEGLATIPAGITESAEAVGLPPRARLLRVYLPVAAPHVTAGVRTSAVISVGTATLAALVGARGLGDLVLQGIALRDTARVLEGAVPAALLALILDGAFALLARRQRRR
jgi:osmoprotectant transport system permease protein